MKFWTSRGRNYEKPPKIKSLPAFVSAFRQWWARLQPPTRREEGAVWPLLRNAPADAAAWSALRRGGCNGIFMVLMCLSWWFASLSEGDDTSELQLAVEDVTWACTTMVPLIPDSTVAAPSTSAPPRPPTAAAGETATLPPTLTPVVGEQTTALVNTTLEAEADTSVPVPSSSATATSDAAPALPLQPAASAASLTVVDAATIPNSCKDASCVATAPPEPVQDVDMVDSNAVVVGTKRPSPESEDASASKKAKVVV